MGWEREESHAAEDAAGYPDTPSRSELEWEEAQAGMTPLRSVFERMRQKYPTANRPDLVETVLDEAVDAGVLEADDAELDLAAHQLHQWLEQGV